MNSFKDDNERQSLGIIKVLQICRMNHSVPSKRKNVNRLKCLLFRILSSTNSLIDDSINRTIHIDRQEIIFCKVCSLIILFVYPSSENLIDGRRLLQRALGLDHRPHLLHVEHERVQRLLDVVLFVLACEDKLNDNGQHE